MPADNIVFEGRKFNVVQLDVPVHGRMHIHHIVQHPGAAVIIPLLDAENVVLIANRRPAIGQTLLEVPAGTLDPGEAPLTCAHRELTEETGYRAGRMDRLTGFYSSPGIFTEYMHVYLARDLTPGAMSLDDGEEIELRPMRLDDALDAIRTGKITDGKTIIALLYYDRFTRTTRPHQ